MKVVKFGAVWCPGCIIMKPRWKEIEQEFSIDGEFHDYDQEEELARSLNVGNILPVAILYNEDNEEIKRFIGEVSKKEIVSFVEANK